MLPNWSVAYWADAGWVYVTVGAVVSRVTSMVCSVSVRHGSWAITSMWIGPSGWPARLMSAPGAIVVNEPPTAPPALMRTSTAISDGVQKSSEAPSVSGVEPATYVVVPLTNCGAPIVTVDAGAFGSFGST